MKIYFFLLLLPMVLTAQEELPQSTKDALNFGTFNPNPQYVIYGKGMQGGGMQGDAYLDTAWHASTIWFYVTAVRRYDPKASDSISGYPIRVNLLDQIVEFDMGENVKGVDPSAIRRILYQGASGPVFLVNTRTFGADQQDLPGFFQTLATGEMTLLKYTRLIVTKPTYNVALDVGSKDTKLFKRDEYYLFETKGQLQKVKLNKKQLLAAMARRKARLERLIDKERLDLGSEAGAIRLVQAYNTLGQEQ